MDKVNSQPANLEAKEVDVLPFQFNDEYDVTFSIAVENYTDVEIIGDMIEEMLQLQRELNQDQA